MNKFIVIEGLDGAGKSTQVRLLLEYFDRKGLKTKFIHFPTTEKMGVYGDLIARFLRGEFGKLEEVHPQLVALIFALDRMDFAPTINRWLADGYTVLADRYVLSNIAFQCAKLKTEAEKAFLSKWIYDFEFDYNKIPRPDVSLYLEVPFSFTKKSLQNNRGDASRAYLQGGDDIHEGSLDFQEDVKREYDRILGDNAGFVKIDCSDGKGGMAGISVIHEKIVGCVAAEKG
jgi:dTMP kinase